MQHSQLVSSPALLFTSVCGHAATAAFEIASNDSYWYEETWLRPVPVFARLSLCNRSAFCILHDIDRSATGDLGQVWRQVSITSNRVTRTLHFQPWVVAPRKARCRAARLHRCAVSKPYFCAPDIQLLPPVSSAQTSLPQENKVTASTRRHTTGIQVHIPHKVLFAGNNIQLKQVLNVALAASTSNDARDKIDHPTSKAVAESNKSLIICADLPLCKVGRNLFSLRLVCFNPDCKVVSIQAAAKQLSPSDACLDSCYEGLAEPWDFEFSRQSDNPLTAKS